MLLTLPSGPNNILKPCQNGSTVLKAVPLTAHYAVLPSPKKHIRSFKQAILILSNLFGVIGHLFKYTESIFEFSGPENC
jgi:hypothetical protein